MYDLVLIHPPTRMDFRERGGIHGPLSDSVPSTSVFEMYPMGFVSILDFLESRGYKVRIVNLALKMLVRKRWDPEKLLRKLKARVFGIDFHWLVHLQGAMELAELLKKLHPESSILLGGVSASYYHKELILRPAIDGIIRGDLAEYSIEEYLRRSGSGSSLASVPQLTWKDEGTVKENDKVPGVTHLDGVHTSYFRLVVHMAKYLDPLGAMPYYGWWRNPAAAVFSLRGCTENCIHCGGSAGACRRIYGRSKPLVKSPEVLLEEIEEAARLIGGPIFIGGDTARLGGNYVARLFRGLEHMKLKNHVILEFAVPPAAEILDQVSKALQSYSVQLSPETHDETLRRNFGRNFSNREMEDFISRAMEKGCKNVKLFFMIGLPGQNAASVMETVEYAGRLLTLFDGGKIYPFLSVLAPFLDPGSELFERAEHYGFTKRRGELDDFREAFARRRWRDVLGYETDVLSVDDLVAIHYKAQKELIRIKAECGLLSARRARARIDLFEKEEKALQAEAGGEKEITLLLSKYNRLYEEKEISFFRLPRMSDMIRTAFQIIPPLWRERRTVWNSFKEKL